MVLVDETGVFDISTLPCANWFTLKLTVPVGVPGAAVAVATEELDDAAEV